MAEIAPKMISDAMMRDICLTFSRPSPRVNNESEMSSIRSNATLKSPEPRCTDSRTSARRR